MSHTDDRPTDDPASPGEVCRKCRGSCVIPGILFHSPCVHCDRTGKEPIIFSWESWKCPNESPPRNELGNHASTCECAGTGCRLDPPIGVSLTIFRIHAHDREYDWWTLGRVRPLADSERVFQLLNGHRFRAYMPGYRLEPLSSPEGTSEEWMAIARTLESGKGEAGGDRVEALWVPTGVTIYSPRNSNWRRPVITAASARELAWNIRRVIRLWKMS